MTRDDFQKSASATDKTNRGGNGDNSAKILPLRPQLHGPRAPVPRAPMPKAPFGMHIMPVATSIRVLPEVVKSGSRHVRAVESEDAKDEK